MNSEMKSRIIRFTFFPVLFVFMELFFHVYYYGSLQATVIYAVIFAAAYGGFVTFASMLFCEKANRIVAYVLLTVVCIMFNLQLVYGKICRTFISMNSVQQNLGDATEFWKEALKGILGCLPGVLVLLVMPFVLLKILRKKGLLVFKRERAAYSVGMAAGAWLLYMLNVTGLTISGTDAHTPYDLYHKNWVLDLGVEKLGIITSEIFDIKQVLFDDLKEDIVDYAGLGSLEIATPIPVQSVTPLPTPTLAPSATPTPTPTPIDTSPNVMDIDFAALAEEETQASVKSLHEYMAEAEPTRKNEYTGVFEGYNLIYIIAEGYSPWAVDEKVTPTLYKLTHEGFVFENFYNPIWYTSTSDGEYVACTGLIPYSTNSFKRSKNNSLPLCFGHQFSKLGYSTRAYHNHTATYYGREYTHPNMGYEFKARGAGLDIEATWPESDLEMMQVTIPEYINDEQFHVYYMTVSGHLEYNFEGNAMAKKNEESVSELPYSEGVKAYIACNKELDLALEYLIEQLEEAGIADRTVIAMGGDHYPYGLSDDEIDEVAGHAVDRNFELYRNNFVIWTPSIETPIVVDKYCSSLDMLPTLSNLFGIEYDSRLMMGSDILSDTPALVIFSNQSFITDYCKYNSKNKEITMLQDVELPEDYIDSVIEVIRNKFEVSKSILLNDYYSYLGLEQDEE